MPTPIQHLAIARDSLADPTLPPSVGQLLTAQRGAFLLGAIAPDVQSISGQAREATHFFTFPSSKGKPLPAKAHPAHQVMLTAHPTLARADTLPADQAAFIAGYISHLALDELWIIQIFEPHFRQAKWGALRERMLIHNVLRTWLDRQSQLESAVREALAQVEPRGWLPFVADKHLRAWRDEIAAQLRPGAVIHTVEVFAARLGVLPDKLRRVLESPDAMQQRVFSRIPADCIDRFCTDARALSVSRIIEYLGGA